VEHALNASFTIGLSAGHAPSRYQSSTLLRSMRWCRGRRGSCAEQFRRSSARPSKTCFRRTAPWSNWPASCTIALVATRPNSKNPRNVIALTVLSLPNMFTAGAVHRIPWFLLG